MFQWYITKEKLQPKTPLCPSCVHAQFMRGRWASERVALCGAHAGSLLRIQFAVFECSGYSNRNELIPVTRIIRGFSEAA